MNTKALTQFLMWNSIINGSILLIWTFLFMACPDFIYGFHTKIVPIPRDNFNVLIYGLIGLFKILIFIFNIVPLIALLILNNKKT